MSVLQKTLCSGSLTTESPLFTASIRKQRGVLVVDDEEMIRSVLTVFFRKRETPLWLASNGAHAVEIYRDHLDDIGLVLMDVKMPGWDGPFTYARLKDLNRTLVCYFMSGNWDPYTEADLLNLGAAALVSKPFHFKQIDDILQRHLVTT